MYPPISFNTLGLFASCSVAYYEPLPGGEPAVEGVYDLVTGEASFDKNNLIIATVIGEACSRCTGDSSPNDAADDGTCDGGARPGAACDVHGISNGDVPFLTSWDCPTTGTPTSFTPIPGTGLTTASIRWGYDPNRPNCTAGGFEAAKCLCGVCENTNTACFRDTQCEAPAVCGWPGDMDEIATRPNSCTDAGVCDWDPESQTGTCDGTAGADTSCLPADDDVIVRGDAQVRDGFYISTLAGLLCLGSFGDPTTDSIVGFPGPVVLRLPYRVTPKR
jgi:hypothetical protein